MLRSVLKIGTVIADSVSRLFAYLNRKRLRKAYENEVALDAAQNERRARNIAREIDDRIAGMSDDAVRDELRKRARRQ